MCENPNGGLSAVPALRAGGSGGFRGKVLPQRRTAAFGDLSALWGQNYFALCPFLREVRAGVWLGSSQRR